MPGASGTGITPQKALKLRNVVPNKDKIAKSTLDTKKQNKVINV